MFPLLIPPSAYWKNTEIIPPKKLFFFHFSCFVLLLQEEFLLMQEKKTKKKQLEQTKKYVVGYFPLLHHLKLYVSSFACHVHFSKTIEMKERQNIPLLLSWLYKDLDFVCPIILGPQYGLHMSPYLLNFAIQDTLMVTINTVPPHVQFRLLACVFIPAGKSKKYSTIQEPNWHSFT